MRDSADAGATNDAADPAISRVLGAEREARRSIERARAATDGIAEQARLSARRTAERAERRTRRVVQAFERDTVARLAEIDAATDALVPARALTADERALLQAAIATLARRLAGASP